MIPEFNEQGFLPPGLYDTTLTEIRSILGFTERRNGLMDGLERYVRVWEKTQLIDHLIIDGSFVTLNAEPRDIDIILVPQRQALFSSRFSDLAKVYCYDRSFTKTEFGCEAFFVAGQGDLQAWTEFFSHDRQGNIRGLLQLRFPL